MPAHHNVGVPLLPLVQRLERFERLLSGSLCASSITRKALVHSYPDLITAVGSGLQQANGFTEISFKPQLADLICKKRIRRSLCVYVLQQFSGFLQVTLGLINMVFKCTRGVCRLGGFPALGR